MEFDFEIEIVLAPQGYVIAREVLGGGRWNLGPEATLNGYAIQRWTDVPRSQRRDLFAFAFRDKRDAGKFTPGQRVKLKA